MNALEKTIRKKLKIENLKIDKLNDRLAIMLANRPEKAKEIKLEIMRLSGKCEAYIEILKIIIEE